MHGISRREFLLQNKVGAHHWLLNDPLIAEPGLGSYFSGVGKRIEGLDSIEPGSDKTVIVLPDDGSLFAEDVPKPSIIQKKIFVNECEPGYPSLRALWIDGY